MISKAKISVFDLDHTLIKANCSYQFGSYLYSQKQFSFFSMVAAVSAYSLHKAGLLSPQHLHERLFRSLFKGRSFNSMKKMASDYVQNALPELLYEPAVKRLRAAQESGHRTLLLSGSPDFLVSHFAEALKVDNWLATPYVVENQRFSSIGPVLVGAEKCKHVKDFEREQLFIYSDSHLDLPLLELAGHSIAVNPSRQLRHFALKRGWEIL